MSTLRAIEVTRGFGHPGKEPDRDVLFGTHFESTEAVVKVWNGDTLVYLHQNMAGSVKDIGSKEEYISIVTARESMRVEMMKIQNQHYAISLNG